MARKMKQCQIYSTATSQVSFVWGQTRAIHYSLFFLTLTSLCSFSHFFHSLFLYCGEDGNPLRVLTKESSNFTVSLQLLLEPVALVNTSTTFLVQTKARNPFVGSVTHWTLLHCVIGPFKTIIIRSVCTGIVQTFRIFILCNTSLVHKIQIGPNLCETGP
jgi:hypothetical protein